MAAGVAAVAVRQEILTEILPAQWNGRIVAAVGVADRDREGDDAPIDLDLAGKRRSPGMQCRRQLDRERDRYEQEVNRDRRPDRYAGAGVVMERMPIDQKIRIDAEPGA